MRNKDKVLSVLIIVIFIFLIANLGAINNFLAATTDKYIEFGHTRIIIPEAWNTTDEMGLTEEKSNKSFTNGYVVWEIWEDWPEDHITQLSRDLLMEAEDQNYVVLNTSNVMLGGVNVSREYFENPTRNTNTTWDCVGVTYVFSKENTNYSVQIHYFTESDYNNPNYTRELDDRFEDFMVNLQNTHYIGIITEIYNWVTGKNQ